MHFKKLLAASCMALAACGLLSLAAARAGDGTSQAHALFFEANKAYKNADYKTASRLYGQLAQSGSAGPDVFYNLGNCFLREDRLGEAILCYERARILRPRDPDLDFNLRFARGRLTDQAEKESSPLAWLSVFSGAEVFWAFALAHLLLCGSLAARALRRTEGTFYAVIALFLLWAMTGLFGLAKWHEASSDARAVAVAPVIEVRAGPSEKDTLLFRLHAGTVVAREREEGPWSLIRFSEQKRGWTLSQGVIPVRPLDRMPRILPEADAHA